MPSAHRKELPRRGSRRPSRACPWLLALAFVSACATPATIHHIAGQATGDLTRGTAGRFQHFAVLGVSSRRTVFLDQPSSNATTELHKVDAPEGTLLVVPVLQDWWLSYGEVQDGLRPAFAWKGEDHHILHGIANVAVVDLYRNLSNRPQITAEVMVRMQVTDENFDKRWNGGVEYSLLFLGDPQSP